MSKKDLLKNLVIQDFFEDNLEQREFSQGDIFATNKGDGKSSYTMIFNQTCDLSIHSFPKISKMVLFELEPVSDLDADELDKIVGKTLAHEEGGRYRVNLDPDFKDKILIPGCRHFYPFLIRFQNIISVDKEIFLSELDPSTSPYPEKSVTENVSTVRLCTVKAPNIENIMCKFGYYYSRVAISTYYV